MAYLVIGSCTRAQKALTNYPGLFGKAQTPLKSFAGRPSNPDMLSRCISGLVGASDWTSWSFPKTLKLGMTLLINGLPRLPRLHPRRKRNPKTEKAMIGPDLPGR